MTWNGRIYVLGGLTQQDNAACSARVLSSAVDPATGVLDPVWRDETPMPVALEGIAGAVVQGRIYVLGGRDVNGNIVATAYSAPINPDGSLGAWRAETSLPDKDWLLASAASPTSLYYAGGQDGFAASNLLADVRYRSFAPGVTLASATAAGLGEGPHVASATARDLAGNVAVSTAGFFVDLTAPKTTLAVLPSSRVVGGTVYALLGSSFVLNARDYPAGAASGVATTTLLADGTSYALNGATVTLSEGSHLLQFYSVDAVGNRETAVNAAVKLDGTPPSPVTDLAGTALSTDSVAVSWTTPGDDGAQGAIADAQVRLAFGTDPTAFSSAAAQVAVDSGTLLPGTGLARTIQGLSPGTVYWAAVYTRDTAGNWSLESATTSVKTLPLDILPPRTTLAFTGPSVQVGSFTFVGPSGTAVLVSTDDLDVL
ncbi:MAG: fibronectin type III domain-containing protein, partial [Elusimicrobia bacterium]|nr:fibronectin type III domain-containing protein [Elusimicrobiota bacterium]